MTFKSAGSLRRVIQVEVGSFIATISNSLRKGLICLLSPDSSPDSSKTTVQK